jgi:hypothetical protein
VQTFLGLDGHADLLAQNRVQADGLADIHFICASAIAKMISPITS